MSLSVHYIDLIEYKSQRLPYELVKSHYPQWFMNQVKFTVTFEGIPGSKKPLSYADEHDKKNVTSLHEQLVDFMDAKMTGLWAMRRSYEDMYDEDEDYEHEGNNYMILFEKPEDKEVFVKHFLMVAKLRNADYQTMKAYKAW